MCYGIFHFSNYCFFFWCYFRVVLPFLCAAHIVFSFLFSARCPLAVLYSLHPFLPLSFWLFCLLLSSFFASLISILVLPSAIPSQELQQSIHDIREKATSGQHEQITAVKEEAKEAKANAELKQQDTAIEMNNFQHEREQLQTQHLSSQKKLDKLQLQLSQQEKDFIAEIKEDEASKRKEQDKTVNVIHQAKRGH